MTQTDHIGDFTDMVRDNFSPEGRRRNFINPMTNQERIKLRIQRDKARKAEKRRERIEKHGTFERVITMQNLHRSLKRRRQEVEWKGSVQRYIAHAPVRMKRAKDSLLAGGLPVYRSNRKRNIYERGKARDINAIMIDARVIQGDLCDSCITPLTQPSLIYDNPASTKGKGVSHARRRNLEFIREEVQKHGKDLYALTYDYSGYFKSIKHSVCRERLQRAGLDERLTNLVMTFIKLYQEQDIEAMPGGPEKQNLLELLRDDKLEGATLGSQISQDMALVVPNPVDHAVKDGERIKSYIRFMDDGIAYGAKETLKRLMEVIRQTSAAVGLKLNEKKTHIVRMSKGVTFLKVRYSTTDTRRIICKIVKDSIVRERRKLKKFRRLIDQGKMAIMDACISFKTWWGTVKSVANTYRQRKRMLRLYNDLFHGYGLKGMKIS